MGYKVTYDDGEILVKKIYIPIFHLFNFKMLTLGQWHKVRNKYCYYTNWSMNLNRLNEIVNELKLKL